MPWCCRCLVSREGSLVMWVRWAFPSPYYVLALHLHLCTLCHCWQSCPFVAVVWFYYVIFVLLWHRISLAHVHFILLVLQVLACLGRPLVTFNSPCACVEYFKGKYSFLGTSDLKSSPQINAWVRRAALARSLIRVWKSIKDKQKSKASVEIHRQGLNTDC